MLADLPGEYRVCLTVENSEGLQSVATAASCTTFNVLPASQLHVQLTWPEVDNADQDLHLVYVENDPRVCNQESDCHWRNCKYVCIWNHEYKSMHVYKHNEFHLPSTDFQSTRHESNFRDNRDVLHVCDACFLGRRTALWITECALVCAF